MVIICHELVCKSLSESDQRPLIRIFPFVAPQPKSLASEWII